MNSRRFMLVSPGFVAYHIGKGRSLSDDTPATTFNAIEP
jgi:hypothetical protein